MPVEWPCHEEAAPSQCLVASISCRECATSSSVTGVVGSTDEPVSSSCALSVPRSRSDLPLLPAWLSRLRPFPEQSAPIIDSPGQSDWLAMHVPSHLDR